MNGIAIDYVIDSCHQNTREKVNHLQTETNSGKIAEMQGNIKGYAFLLELLKEEFELDDDTILDSGNIPTAPDHLESTDLTDLAFDFETLVADERWFNVSERLKDDEIEMGSYLLHEGKNARSMKVSQGKLSAQTCVSGLLVSVQDAKKRQDDREDEARKNPSLPFVDVPEIDIEDLP